MEGLRVEKGLMVGKRERINGRKTGEGQRMRRQGRIKGKDQGWRRGEESEVRLGKSGIIKGEKKTEREGLSVTGRVKV